MSNVNCTLSEYPYRGLDTTNVGQFMEDAKTHIEDICFTRKSDIGVVQNLPNIFILGRKVGRIPSSSADVIAGDKIGDFNVTDTYAYYLVESGGVGVWRRIAVGSW